MREKRVATGESLTFKSLGGWDELDHLAGFSCFLKSADKMLQQLPKAGQIGVPPDLLNKAGMKALEYADNNRDANGALTLRNSNAREFFETTFLPRRFSSQSFSGFVTGYYEPEVKASRKRHGKFQYPIYRKPDDLVKIDDTTRPEGMDTYFRFARKAGEQLVEYHDREAIQNGALDGKGYELFFLADPVDVFFIHIQGSARLALDDGSHTRITYAAKTGHPYTAIGKVLVERGDISREKISMDSIRDWLKSHPGRMNDVFKQNRSYIFFAENGGQAELNSGPVAAAGVPLTPGHSIAVDRLLHTFGTPVFLRTAAPFPWEERPFSRLMVAQDTGSAIVGSQRGDLFIGSGKEAGKLAGHIQHRADFVFLWPKG